jgi:hypothetical protein
MKAIQIKTLGDLFPDGACYVEIVNPLKGDVVRKLTRIRARGKPDMCLLDALIETVNLPLNTLISYTPWVFDRGNLTFQMERGGGVMQAKLCTEADILRIMYQKDRLIYPPLCVLDTTARSVEEYHEAQEYNHVIMRAANARRR